VRLGPLLRCELAEYIAHHLALARHRPVFFSASALDRLLLHSRGIPLQVNLLCACALTGRKTHIGAVEIDAAAFASRTASPAADQGACPALLDAPQTTARRGVGSIPIRGGKRGPRARLGAAAIAGVAGVSFGVAYLHSYDPGLIRLDQIDFARITSIGAAQSRLVDLVWPGVAAVRSIPVVQTAEAETARSDPPRASPDDRRGALQTVGVVLAQDANAAHGASPVSATSATSASQRPADIKPVATHLWPGTEDLPDGRQSRTAPNAEAAALPVLQQGAAAAAPPSGAPLHVAQAETPAQSRPAAKQPADSPAQDAQPPAVSAPAIGPRESAGAASMPAARRPTIDAAPLMARGQTFLQQGDIASARLFFERAAKHGDVAAMTALARTFDPVELRRHGVLGIKGDPNRAMELYRSAASAGDATAQQSMTRLSDWIERTR
jgi:hypothetical protein